MSTEVPVAPRAPRVQDVLRDVADLVTRLRALGVDPGPSAPGAPELESADRTVGRAIDGAVRRLASAPPAQLVLLSAIIAELSGARRSIHANLMAGRGRLPRLIDDGLVRLRNVPTTAGLLDRVCAEAALSCGLSRVALSTVAETDWSVWRVHDTTGASGTGDLVSPELLAMAQRDAPHERRVLRTGAGTIVGAGAGTSPMTALFPRSHVIVPIRMSTGTIGLLHADRHPADRAVDAVDRDLLEAFARAFGAVFERTALQERLDRQGRALTAALKDATSYADEVSAAGFALPGTDADVPPVPSMPGAPGANAAIDALLTPREREVLALILAGASNVAIAEQLVITTGTAKTHVKHILRKLGAVNRSEAISRYLEIDAGG